MSRLTARLAGSGKAPHAPAVAATGGQPADVYGITLADGTHYLLEGQPPLAPVGNWGNLSFLYFSRRRW